MKKIICPVVLLLLNLTVAASAQSRTFLQQIAGNWEGALEYADYSDATKRVKLKTYLTVTPATDGNSAEFVTVYDDFGRIIKSVQIVTVDPAARKYSAGETEYKIDFQTDGKIVLLGSGQDGEKIEPIRQTITFDENSLGFLKETRSPWQFRNQLIFKRAAENALAKKTLPPAKLKEDFDVLKKTLLALHPGIYRYQTPAEMKRIFDDLEAKLGNPLPEGEFFKLVAQLASRIRCGHTFPNPYNQDGLARERLFNERNYLPLYFQIVGGRMVVTESAAQQTLARGSEIRKINGVPAGQIIKTLLTVTNADGRATVAHRLRQIELARFEAERYALFDWYFPLFFPLKDGFFTIEAVDFKTKKPVTLRLPAVTKAERTAEMEKRYGQSPTYDDGWKFEIWPDETAYLKIENSITWRLKKIKYKEFFAAAFAEMRAKNVKNLIIDLRGNDGGDTGIGYELSRYLARRNLPPYLESRRLVRNVAPQPELAGFLDAYSKDLRDTILNGVAENLYRKAENDFFEMLPNEKVTSYPEVTPDPNNFQGQTFIISDASNASASFQFLNYARENRLARIVGQETGGNRQGINGGNYFFLRLPNSKIEIDVPVYFIAPLVMPQKDESLAPDIPVERRPADVGNNFDREIFVVRQLIKRN
jgi:hypothetical protein